MSDMVVQVNFEWRDGMVYASSANLFGLFLAVPESRLDALSHDLFPAILTLVEHNGLPKPPAPDARLLALSTVLYDIATEPDSKNADAHFRYNAAREKARRAINWEPGKESK